MQAVVAAIASTVNVLTVARPLTILLPQLFGWRRGRRGMLNAERDRGRIVWWGGSGFCQSYNHLNLYNAPFPAQRKR